MNYSTAIFLINDDVRALYVNFGTTKRAHLVKTMDRTIANGDFVVVPIPPNTLGVGFAVAEVMHVDVEVDFDEEDEDVPWVVCRIDMAAFNDIVEREKEAINIIRKSAFQEKRRKLAESLLSAKAVRALPLVKQGDDTRDPMDVLRDSISRS